MDQIHTLTRDLIKEPSAAHWTNADVDRKINLRHKLLCAELVNASSGWFLRYVDISYVANQFVYALPTLCQRVHRLERIDGQYPQEVKPISLAEAWAHRSILALNPYRTVDAYAIAGPNFEIVPTPSSAITNALRMHYSKRQPDLSSGTTTSATSTTLTAASSTTKGVFDIDTDAYEGCRIAITGGTDVNDVQKITAWNPTTRVFTVASWTTTPTATSTWAIVPEFPDEWHMLIAYGAAIDLLMESKEDTTDATREYNRFDEIMRTQIGLRQEQSAPRVIYVPE